jgi:outer membrane protein TolC
MRVLRRFAFSVSFLSAAPALAQEQTTVSSAGEPRATLPVVDLAEAVRQALARNPTAVVAREEIARAEALLEQTRSSSLPTLTGTGTYTRLDSDRTLGGTTLAYANQLNANAVLNVPLLAPRAWAQWSHAGETVDTARLSQQDVRRKVALAVARAYLNVVAQKRVIDAAERARDTDRAHYDYAHQRYAGGVGNRIDEVRAEQQLQSDEANVQRQYADLSRDREALGVLVGVGGPLDAQEPNLEAPTDAPQAMRDAEHRSDVAAAEVRLRAAEHTVRDDWTDYAPLLSGIVEPFYNTPATATAPTTGWQAQLVLTVPFYDGGLRYGLAKERAALRSEADAGLQATLRQARSDVRTAFEEVRRADAALRAAQEAARLAESGRQLAEIAYRAGASTNIEVIDAERTARDAETAVAVAEDGARQARLDLLAASGRFP